MSAAAGAGDAFKSLHWHRLAASLLNSHTSQKMTAHPVAVMEAIVKGVTAKVGHTGPMIFHMRGRRHSTRLRQGDRLLLDMLFFQCAEADVARWEEGLAEYHSDPVTGSNFSLL